VSGNLTAVREMSGILLKSGKCQGKNLVREKLPKTFLLAAYAAPFLTLLSYKFHFGFGSCTVAFLVQA